MKVFHTAAQQWQALQPCSHVGTYESAIGRARTKFGNTTFHIAECDFKSSRPLRILDDQAGNDPISWLSLARHNGWINPDDIELITQAINGMDRSSLMNPPAGYYAHLKCQAAMAAALPHFRRLGYDSFIYENKVEYGGHSHMIFDSSQVSIISWCEARFVGGQLILGLDV